MDFPPATNQTSKNAAAVARWVKRRSYTVSAKNQKDYLCLTVNTADGQWTADVYFYRNSKTRRLVTVGQVVPFDMLLLIAFKNDPDLHWTFLSEYAMPHCGLCTSLVTRDPFCLPCYQKRLAYRAGTQWLLVAPRLGLNSDLVGYIAQIIGQGHC